MLERYARQVLLSEIGDSGQARLKNARVAVMGCGGLGTVVSDLLVRAGVGFVRIVDRDIVELSNLQRQNLYDEADVAGGRPKVEAAAEKLRRVNSQVVVDPCVLSIGADNIETLIRDVDLVCDGTDNYDARYLINDACVKHGVPWVYGSVAATFGMVQAIVPSRTPCLQCLMGAMPLAGSTPGTDTIGVWAAAVHVIASIEASEGLKLLLGKPEELYHRLFYVDVWNGEFEKLLVKRREDCPVCVRRRFMYLGDQEAPWIE